MRKKCRWTVAHKQKKKKFIFTGAFKMEKSRKINPTFIPVAEVRAPP